MAKMKKRNRQDVMLGLIIGFLIAIILASLVNAYIFKKIIRENRAQSQIISEFLEQPSPSTNTELP